MYVDTAFRPGGFNGNRIRTILVVDDEETIRMVVSDYLLDFGYAVIEAENAARAREILRTRPVDLVLSDVDMPGGENGFGLEKWIRAEYPDVRVILTSGYPQGAEKLRDLAEPLIVKPYSLEMVEKRIERSLGA